MRNVGRLIGTVLVVLALLALIVLIGGGAMMGFGGYNTRVGMIGTGMMGGYSMFGWTIPPMFWAFLIGGLGLLLIWLERGSGRSLSATPVGGSPLEILKARYARSEITKEQFSEMRKNLGG